MFWILTISMIDFHGFLDFKAVQENICIFVSYFNFRLIPSNPSNLGNRNYYHFCSSSLDWKFSNANFSTIINSISFLEPQLLLFFLEFLAFYSCILTSITNFCNFIFDIRRPINSEDVFERTFCSCSKWSKITELGAYES